MERRDFFKRSALLGATAALDGCGSPDHQLIRFIPEEDLTPPGQAVWKPGVCTLCSSGCGLQVRVMQGDAEVIRHGQVGITKMSLAKKLEGNPSHPVNQGKLCARGQAGLQVLYHPDRLRNPLKRNGQRGSGNFTEISWDDALAEITTQLSALRSGKNIRSLAFLSRPLRGQRRELVERFVKAFGAPPPLAYEPFDEAVLRQANLLSFGQAQLPTFDLARADYVISFGADFLGTWNSPVAQSIGYGEMRQGRPGRRGKFVQIEPRMSQTGANADEWFACRLGMEGALALGLAHVILSEKLRPQTARTRAAAQIPGWDQGLPAYTPENAEKQTGVPAKTITRLAREIARADVGVALVGGAPLAQTNGLFNALAVNALTSLIASGHVSALSFTPRPPLPASLPPSSRTDVFDPNAWNGTTGPPAILLLYDANPLYAAPAALRVRETLGNIPYIASFGSFIDETSALADLILPDSAALETWTDDVPESGSTQAVASVAPPAVHTLHNTRPMTDVLLDVAQRLGGDVAKALPYKTYDAMLQAAFTPLRQRTPNAPKSDDDFWANIQTQGGWWAPPGAAQTPNSAASAAQRGTASSASDPEFDGSVQEYPFYFLPYASQQFRDGSVAHLPWLQELPDPTTAAMWSSWVELNPKTAERLHIQQGDMVEVASQHGTLRAPALIYPGIAPDLIAMPAGQGHENFSRYATGRGANAYSILAPLTERETGALAWAATRVKLTRIGGSEEGKLTLFAGGMSRFPIEEEPR